MLDKHEKQTRVKPPIRINPSTELLYILPVILSWNCSFLQEPSPGFTPPWPLNETESTGLSDADHFDLKGELPLTLTTAISLALERNPEAAAARWTINIHEAMEEAASSGHYPDLIVSGGYRRHWHKERLVPARGPDATSAAFSRNIFWADVTLNIPIFSGGRVTRAAKAAEWMTKAARHQKARTREELVFKVKTAFYNLLVQEKLLEVLSESRKILEQHHELIREMLASEKAAPVDVLKIEVRLAAIKSTMEEQQGLYEIGSAVLANLLGAPTPDPGTQLIKGSLKRANPHLDLTRLSNEAIRRRADLKELETRMSAQANMVEGAKADYWPTISAAATFGPRLSTEGDYDDLGYIGINFGYSLFGWLYANPKIRAASAELRVLSEKRKNLILSIYRDVRTAVSHVQTAISRIVAMEVSIEKAREVLRVEREKAAIGHDGSTRDVLDAQTELLTAEINYYRAIAALHTSLALLDLATGKEH